MMLFQNPIIWLLRFRHRKGYGVHSPFAFGFITDVLYNKECYYAYEDIDKVLKWWQGGRVKSMHRLLFRLSNYHRPKTMYLRGVGESVVRACKCGSQGVRIVPSGEQSPADMILLDGADESAMKHVAEGTMVVVKNIHRCPNFWRRLKADDRLTVTFDLYDIGIAFARNDLNEQHYIVNW